MKYLILVLTLVSIASPREWKEADGAKWKGQTIHMLVNGNVLTMYPGKTAFVKSVEGDSLILAVYTQAGHLENITVPKNSCSYWNRNDNTMENISIIIRDLFFLSFFSPVGWGVLFLIIVGIIIGIYHTAIWAYYTDWKRIPKAEKRKAILEELEKD